MMKTEKQSEKHVVEDFHDDGFLDRMIQKKRRRETIFTVVDALAALAGLVILLLVAHVFSGCSNLADQGLNGCREGRVILDGIAGLDTTTTQARTQFDGDEDGLESANGTTGYAAWYLSVTQPGTVGPPTPGK